EVSDTIKRWLTSDLWSVSELFWMKGETPSYIEIYEFSKRVSELLDRHCLAYRIKDKRKRDLQVRVVSGEIVELGTTSSHWLLGLGSPKRTTFTRAENKQISVEAARFFQADCDGWAEQRAADATAPLELFQTA